MRSRAEKWFAPAAQNPLAAFLLLLLLAIPFVFAPLDAITHGVASAGLAAPAIILMAWMLASRPWDLSRASVRGFLRAGANTPVVLLLAWVLVSAAAAPRKDVAAQDLLRVASGAILYFVAAYRIRRSEQLARLQDVLVISLLLLAVLAGRQVLSEQESLSGPFAEPEAFASLVVLLLPFAAGMAVLDSNPGRRLLGEVALVVGVASVALARSPGSWFGAVAGLLALGAFVVWALVDAKRGASRSMQLTRAACVLVAAAAMLAVIVAPSPWRARLSAPAQPGEAVARATARHTALQMLSERPVVGGGPGSQPFQSQQAESGPGTPARRDAPPSLSDVAPGLYLETAAEYGVVGLLLLCAIPLAVLVGGLRRSPRMDVGIRQTMLVSAMAAVAALVIDGTGSRSWQFATHSAFAWAVFGIGAGMLRPHSHTPVDAPVPTLSLRTSRFLGFAVCAALAPLLIWSARSPLPSLESSQPDDEPAAAPPAARAVPAVTPPAARFDVGTGHASPAAAGPGSSAGDGRPLRPAQRRPS